MLFRPIFKQDYPYNFSQQEIHHLIDGRISALHSAMGHVQFVAVRYVGRISKGSTVHSEMQARTILLGNNESYRTCTGNSTTLLGMTRVSGKFMPRLKTAGQKGQWC
jgi:hypothetical protein